MENENYYDILAKKLDNSLSGLSKQCTKGNISKTWMNYLKTLVDPNDVQYLIQLDVFPATMSVKKFAKKINKTEEEAQIIIDRLFKSDILMSMGKKRKKYAIHLPFLIFDAPPLGYDEIPIEKAKQLAKLSLEYLEDEEWYRNFEGSPQTPLSRIIPVQQSLQVETTIMPYEDLEKLIDDAETIALQTCACRKRREVLGIRKCDYPIESCIALDVGASYSIDRGHGREISKEEAKNLLKEFNEMGLVHCTENFQEGSHSLICNCCACCCSLIGGITRYDNPRAVAASNFVAEIKHIEDCAKCETCIDKCNFKAITMGDNGPQIDANKCMGCGVCIVNCPQEVIELRRFKREVIHKDLFELSAKVIEETRPPK